MRAGGTGKWRRDAVFMSRLDSPRTLEECRQHWKVMVDCVGECCVRWGYGRGASASRPFGTGLGAFAASFSPDELPKEAARLRTTNCF